MYSAISLQDVEQRYGTQPALTQCTLQISAGETYGLLGPAGSGKTTLLQVIVGFLIPQQGRVQVLGRAPHTAPRRIGYLPAGRPYLTHLTPRSYLWNFARVAGMSAAQATERSAAILDLVGLTESADLGMADAAPLQLQRFGLAQTLLGEPELVVIDDPLRGLDSQAAQEFLSLIGQTRRRGQTTVIAARTPGAVETLCDRVGILRAGTLLRETTLHTLRGTALTVRIRTSPLPIELQRSLRYLDQALQISSQEIVIFNNSSDLQQRLLRVLLDAQVTIYALQPLETQLDRFYRQTLRNDNVEPPAALPPADETQGLLTTLLASRSSAEDDR